jgi:hypothetical protein
MFQSGMKESLENQIIIDNIEFDIFYKICLYLYTGDPGVNNCDLISILKILEVSDEFMLDEVKFACENKLVSIMNE